MFTSKWAKTTAARIESRVLDESTIRAMRKILKNAINAVEYHKRNPLSSATPAEAYELLNAILRCAPRVTDAQAAKGARWLHNLAWTPRGVRRNTEAAREFSEANLKVLAQCVANPRFALVRLDMDSESVGGGRYYVRTLTPVYRCIGERGASFDYVAQSWQSGGRFEIVSYRNPENEA